MKDYVEQCEDHYYYVAGTRISLASVVYLYRNGFSPESILQNLPLLGSAERVYGAIAFYLANQAAIDAYLKDKEEKYEEMKANQPPLPPALAEKLRRAKEEMAGKRS